MGWIIYALTLAITPLALLAWPHARAPITAALSTAPDRWSRATRWLGRNYVAIVFVAALLILSWAVAIGLWRVPLLVDQLLAQLPEAVADPTDGPDRTRSIITALAAVLAAIAIFGTIVVQSIRVWTSERQTRTIEQGHVTDRLTKAIEQLGAEKTVKRVEKDAAGAEIRDQDGRRIVVETTAPNLEVRLGAIYALERIAADSERDHVTIMEILCAYVRENAPARDAENHPAGEFPERDTTASPKERAELLNNRWHAIQSWSDGLPGPRIDVQAALTVIGRRPATRRRIEILRLDLSQTNLRRASLASAEFSRANLSGARLEGAHLGWARLEGAYLGWARLEEANLGWARLEGAVLAEARLEGANLVGARLEGADLGRARLEGADLRGARLEGADLFKARLEGANLHRARLKGAKVVLARLEGVDLSEAALEEAELRLARLEGADLTGARLDGTNLRLARLEGAMLSDARLEGAELVGARLTGADLGWADFRRASWTEAKVRVSPAHFADFRAGQSLLQSQLKELIGNIGTLLPDTLAPDTEQPYYIWSCWEQAPEDLDAIVARAAGPIATDANRAALRASFLCGPDNPRVKTGTPLALDAPYPDGHPLANRDGPPR